MATDVIKQFTFRVYSKLEETHLQQAMDFFNEDSMLKAIKKLLAKLKYYRELENDHNKLKKEHEGLLELLRKRERTTREINSILNF